MDDQQHIKYVTRAGINTTAWDQCILRASNGLIYGTHEYLDTVCGDWDGLVMNNYETVMPLVWRKKWGFYYLYYPPFCAALGVFGNQLTAETIAQFLSAIPAKFRYWDFPMNQGNRFVLDNFPFTLRNNYVLNLEPCYADISTNYRENLRRNIRKSVDAQYQVSIGFSVQEVIELAKLFTPQAAIEPVMYTRFEKIYTLLNRREQAITYGIRNVKGLLLASAVFMFDDRRAYYILVGNHPDGKTAGASHALLDAFIKDYAGQRLILDFEGTDIRNLAFFYSGYGARTEIYPVIHLNRLPTPVRWFKK